MIGLCPSLFIPGPLPGMNEIIAAAKGMGGRGIGYSRMKRDWGNAVALLAMSAKLPALKGPVFVAFDWVEKDARRDPDNIHAGAKLVLDGLVDAGVLGGDSQKYIKGITHRVSIDKRNPGVRVALMETAAGAA